MASGFAFWGAFFFFLISRTQISWKHCQWDPVTHIYVHEKLKKTDKVLKGRKSSFFPTACVWDTTCKSLQRFGPHLFLIPALCVLWGAGQFPQVCWPCPAFLSSGLWVTLWVGTPWRCAWHSCTGNIDVHGEKLHAVVSGAMESCSPLSSALVGAKMLFRQQFHGLLGSYKQQPEDKASCVT